MFDSLHSKDLSQPRLDQGFPEPHVGHRIEPAGFLKPHLGQPVGGERRWGGLTEPGRQCLAELGDAGDGAAAVAVREDGR